MDKLNANNDDEENNLQSENENQDCAAGVKQFEHLDNVLVVIGQLGTYQKTLICLIFFICFSTAFNNLGYLFWGMRLDHNCTGMPGWKTHSTISKDGEAFRNRSSPWEMNENGLMVPSKCHFYRYNATNDFFYNGKESNLTILEDCKEWTYDTSIVKSSIVQEMNLVCSKKWLVSCTQAAYMFGRLAGSAIYGYLSDRYGRRPTFMISIALTRLFSITLCWVTDVYLFVAIRFLLGIQTTGEFQIAFVIASENVGPQYRPHAGISCHVAWSMGLVLLAGIAYFIRERFWLQIALSLPLGLLLLLYFFVPESPRFLLSAGQKEKCIKHLKHMAEVNKVEYPKEADHQLKAEMKIENFTFRSLFQYPNIRRTTLLLMTSWFTGSFLYYGMSLNATSISGDPYLNFFLNVAIEAPAYVLAIPLVTKFGRIRPVSMCYLIAGVFILIGIFLPNDIPIFVTIMSTLGKGAMTCGYGMMYIITAELYPTKMRSTGFGTCLVSCRLGASLAPFVSDLISIWKHFPFVLFSIVAFISSFLILFLPDASNKPLPQTVEEGELFNSAGRRCFWKRKSKTRTKTNVMANNENKDQQESHQL